MEYILYALGWLWIGIISAAVVCVIRHHPFRIQEAIFGAVFGPLIWLLLAAIYDASFRIKQLDDTIHANIICLIASVISAVWHFAI